MLLARGERGHLPGPAADNGAPAVRISLTQGPARASRARTGTAKLRLLTFLQIASTRPPSRRPQRLRPYSNQISSASTATHRWGERYGKRAHFPVRRRRNGLYRGTRKRPAPLRFIVLPKHAMEMPQHVGNASLND